MANLEKIKEVYYSRYRINGKQIRERLGKTSMTEAKTMVRSIEEKVCKQRLGIDCKERVLIDEIIKEYLEWARNNREHTTYLQKKKSMEIFQDFIKQGRFKNRIYYINDIDYRVIESFKVWRKEQTYAKKKIANRTVNINLTHISNLLRKVKEWGYISSDTQIKKLTETHKHPEYLSNVELQVLIKNSSLYEKQIILLLLNTGMRSGELMNLTWDAVDFIGKAIKIQSSEKKATKTHRERFININSGLLDTLLYLREIYIDPLTNNVSPRESYQKNYVLCHRDGKPIKSFKRSFSSAVVKSGLNKRITPHMLRHSFATLSLECNTDIMTIKEILGHTDISTTQRYLNITNDRKQQAVDKIGSLFDNRLLLTC